MSRRQYCRRMGQLDTEKYTLEHRQAMIELRLRGAVTPSERANALTELTRISARLSELASEVDELAGVTA